LQNKDLQQLHFLHFVANAFSSATHDEFRYEIGEMIIAVCLFVCTASFFSMVDSRIATT